MSQTPSIPQNASADAPAARTPRETSVRALETGETPGNAQTEAPRPETSKESTEEPPAPFVVARAALEGALKVSLRANAKAPRWDQWARGVLDAMVRKLPLLLGGGRR